MSSRRTLILIGALVIGGLAAFLTLNYVRGVENESAEQNQLVEVLVAKGPIAKGTSADDAIATEQVALAKRRRADLPASVVRREAEIRNQVASVDLSGGEIITANMFVADTELSGSKSTSLDKGNVAITISVDQAAGVAGLIQPGDSINILATVDNGDEQTLSNSAPEEGRTGGFSLPRPSVYAFQDVKVLAVGTSLGEPVAATSSDGEPAPPQPEPEYSPLITVQLPPDQAQLLSGIRGADLYLTLNRPDYEPIPIPFFDWVQIFPGEAGVSVYQDESPNEGQ